MMQLFDPWISVIESAVYPACAFQASFPGLRSVMVAAVAMAMGALPFVFSREKAPVATESFLAHLAELRLRLMRILCWMLGIFFVLPSALGALSLACENEKLDLGRWLGSSWRWFFQGAGDIYGILAMPLLDKLPDSGEIIAIGMASPLLVPMKAAFFVTLCAMMPFILFEAWKFIAPGLYAAEKGVARPLIATSAALFYTGMAFAYFLVFQVVFGIVVAVTPDTVNWTPDIGELLGSMLLIFFAFGLVFELPVAMFILVRAGVVEPEDLRKARPYLIVGAFVVAAIVTPPDIWSQIIFALLCWALYEIGLWFVSNWGVKKTEPGDADDNPA